MSIILLCGAWTVGLVIRGLYTQYLVSTQMVEYPSFCFHADLVFQEKNSSLCEYWIFKSVNFSVCILPVHKIVPNS